MQTAYQKRKEELVHLDNFLLSIHLCAFFQFSSHSLGYLLSRQPEAAFTCNLPNLQLPFNIRKHSEITAYCSVESLRLVPSFLGTQVFTSMKIHRFTSAWSTWWYSLNGDFVCPIPFHSHVLTCAHTSIRTEPWNNVGDQDKVIISNSCHNFESFQFSSVLPAASPASFSKTRLSLHQTTQIVPQGQHIMCSPWMFSVQW